MAHSSYVNLLVVIVGKSIHVLANEFSVQSKARGSKLGTLRLLVMLGFDARQHGTLLAHLAVKLSLQVAPRGRSRGLSAGLFVRIPTGFTPRR